MFISIFLQYFVNFAILEYFQTVALGPVMQNFYFVFLIFVISPVFGNYCENATLGSKHANPKNCGNFYLCEANNLQTLVECPVNQLYDFKRNRCDSPSRVSCFNEESFERCPMEDEPCVRITFPNHEDCER